MPSDSNPADLPSYGRGEELASLYQSTLYDDYERLEATAFDPVLR